jgi:hypothetical protein
VIRLVNNKSACSIKAPYVVLGLMSRWAVKIRSFARYRRRFDRCSRRQQAALVRQLSQGSSADWHGPPASLCYFVTRSDAGDVYYGTVQGFAGLGILYIGHIMPPERW